MNTQFALLAIYGDVNIPLEKCCMEFFGLSPKRAAEAAISRHCPCLLIAWGPTRASGLWMQASWLRISIRRRFRRSRSGEL